MTGPTVKDLTVAPFAGMSKELDSLLKDKTESSGGAVVPLADVKSPDHVLLAFIPGVTAEQLDSRTSQQLKVSGALKPLEDSTAKAVEAKLGGKLLQQSGKYVYLVVEGDPWPAAGAPTPAVTP